MIVLCYNIGTLVSTFYFNYILQIYYRQHQQIILFDQKGGKIDKFPLKEIHNVTSSANPQSVLSVEETRVSGENH
jgi:uncharacterized protein YbcV (DUF1398 family)